MTKPPGPQDIFDAVFMVPLLDGFRLTAPNVSAFGALVWQHLQEFPHAVHVEARIQIITTRMEPFFPTVAECRRVCLDIVAAREIAARHKAFDDDLARARKLDEQLDKELAR